MNCRPGNTWRGHLTWTVGWDQVRKRQHSLIPPFDRSKYSRTFIISHWCYSICCKNTRICWRISIWRGKQAWTHLNCAAIENFHGAGRERLVYHCPNVSGVSVTGVTGHWCYYRMIFKNVHRYMPYFLCNSYLPLKCPQDMGKISKAKKQRLYRSGKTQIERAHRNTKRRKSWSMDEMYTRKAKTSEGHGRAWTEKRTKGLAQTERQSRIARSRL